MKKNDKQSVEDAIKESGKDTPLEFLLKIMWNKKNLASIRLEAAKSAAPYVHRKQPIAVEVEGDLDIIVPYVPDRKSLAEKYADDLEPEDRPTTH
jgi:hypothetical protein